MKNDRQGQNTSVVAELGRLLIEWKIRQAARQAAQASEADRKEPARDCPADTR